MVRKTLISIVLASLLLPSISHGQTADPTLRLTVSPLPIRLATKPGTSITTPIRLKNDSTTPENIAVSVLKFSAHNTAGQPELQDPLPTDAFVKWVSFSEPQFTVAPNEWKTITATFTVPPEAAFGYYYAIVFSRADAPTPGQQTAVIGGTAVLVLLEAQVPHAVRQVEVQEFAVDRAWYEFLPVTFQVALRNTGNVHVAPRGNVFISRGQGKGDIALLEVNPEQGSVLPDTERRFTTAWQDGFPVYEATIEEGAVVRDEDGGTDYHLKWDFNNASKLRWGRYTATLLLVYDDGQRDVPLEGSISFWVFPWRLLLAAVAVGLFALYGLWTTVRRFYRRIFKRRRV